MSGVARGSRPGGADSVLDAREHAAMVQIFEECDAVVQFGDFWLQDDSLTLEQPRRMLLGGGDATPWPNAMRRAMSSPVPFVVEGNHEVWPCMDGRLARLDVADWAVQRVMVVGYVHSEGLWVRGAAHIAATEVCGLNGVPVRVGSGAGPRRDAGPLV